MRSGADSDRAGPFIVGIDDRSTLRDLHRSGIRQLPRQFPGIDHQLAPILAADGPRGIRRADAAVPAAVLGQCQDRRFQSVPDWQVAQRHFGIPRGGLALIDDSAEFGAQSLDHSFVLLCRARA
jgi:hypothetical protein